MQEILFVKTKEKRGGSDNALNTYFVATVTTRSNTVYKLSHLRYSQMLQLHEDLKERHPELAAKLPAFPGKTWLTPTKSVWRERISMLNGYYRVLLSMAELESDPGVVEMFHNRDKKGDAEDGERAANDDIEIIDEAVESSVKVGDMTFGYLALGDANSSKTAVFVHGFPDNFHTWDKIMPQFVEMGFYCISMATRGYYPTDIPQEPKYDKYTLGCDILGLISALSRSQVLLCGHDWGATAVWMAAAKDEIDGTHLVWRVIAEAVPPAKAIAFSPGLILKARHFLYFNTPLIDVVAQTQKNNYSYLDDLVERWSPTWKPSARRRATLAIKPEFDQPGRCQAAIAYYKALREKSPEIEACEEHLLSMPVLFICGAMDSGGGLVEMFKKTPEQCQGFVEVCIIRKVGHFLHLEAPKAFMHRIKVFVETESYPEGKQVKVKMLQQGE